MESIERQKSYDDTKGKMKKTLAKMNKTIIKSMYMLGAFSIASSCSFEASERQIKKLECEEDPQNPECVALCEFAWPEEYRPNNCDEILSYNRHDADLDQGIDIGNDLSEDRYDGPQDIAEILPDPDIEEDITDDADLDAEEEIADAEVVEDIIDAAEEPEVIEDAPDDPEMEVYADLDAEDTIEDHDEEGVVFVCLGTVSETASPIWIEVDQSVIVGGYDFYNHGLASGTPDGIITISCADNEVIVEERMTMQERNLITIDVPNGDVIQFRNEDGVSAGVAASIYVVVD